MSDVRVQFYARGHGIEWRLLATNNRELGRCFRPSRELAACRVEVEWLLDHVGECVARLSVELGRWRWSLHLDDDVVAVSARSYARRIECAASVRQFVRALPQAVLQPTVQVFGSGSTG